MSRKIPKKYLRTVLFGIVFVLAVSFAGIIWVLPSSVAAVCPACYGFQETQPDIYVQENVSEEQRAAIVSVIEDARQKLAIFWGPLKAKPRILICSDDDCFRRLGGGGRRGMSLFDKVAVLSPRGSNVTIAAHELSMNEMHHRIGLWAFSTGRIPIWFDEGIAMYSSNDLRYLSPVGQANRCLVATPTEMPTGMLEWNRTALIDRQLYAKAACRTSQWIATHGGAPAVISVVEKIATGESFEEASR
ncbi:hypothetical protein [Kosakonia oryziphila]|jgi:hypothetical protein|uniref:Uncharacterized protein n=1 Tax=Kosakonia oryziphila TaxID=1005667 RepID=A0A1C4FI93_9ENTR|nr:hypothetical protein [Kosakonia oryziphila]SCC55727.1 hypothetical protein GA0061070_103713 [Kosakonia oryziphila]